MRHSTHFKEYDFTAPEYAPRPAFGPIRIYNLLPERLVQLQAARSFQTNLQWILKDTASGDDQWPSLYSARLPFATRPLRKIRAWNNVRV